MVMWRQLGINSWPTLVVVSPSGKVLATLSGEGHRKVNNNLMCYIDKLMSDHKICWSITNTGLGFLYKFQDLDDFISAAFQYYKTKNLLDYHPIPVLLEKDKDTRLVSSPLKFPGKLCTDLANNRLFISDSNYHRIVS